MRTGEPLRESFVNNTPWSAAFISTMVGEVDPKFRKAPLHTEYAVAVRNKQVPGWKALDPSKTRLQPGDIIIRNREGNKLRFGTSWSGLSHGDIVTNVTDRAATVIGGNVEDTVTKRDFETRKGVLTDSEFFAVLRPEKPEVANQLVARVSDEFQTWDAGKWNEKTPEATALLRKYYSNVGLTAPPSQKDVKLAYTIAKQTSNKQPEYGEGLLEAVKKEEPKPEPEESLQFGGGLIDLPEVKTVASEPPKEKPVEVIPPEKPRDIASGFMDPKPAMSEVARPKTDEYELPYDVQRDRYFMAREKALSDERIQKMKSAIDDSDVTDDMAVAEYNRTMFDEIRNIDPEISGYVDSMEEATMRKLRKPMGQLAQK